MVVERRAGDIDVSLADVSAAREAFGYEVVVGFEEGLRRTVEWVRQGTGNREQGTENRKQGLV